MADFSLINSEGSIMTVRKVRDEKMFTMIDEDGIEIAKLNKTALGLYLAGEIILIDSRRREWDYSKVDKNMKGDPSKFTHYLIENL